MDFEYLQQRRSKRERDLAQTTQQLAEVQRLYAQLQGAIAELDEMMNQGKVAADAVSKMFEVKNEPNDSRSPRRGAEQVHAVASEVTGGGVPITSNSDVPLNGGARGDLREGADEAGGTV